MEKKIPLKQKIYLPEYFKGNVAESFKKESDQRILYWNFDKAFDEKVKVQIEILLNETVRIIKNREDRRNRYLLPLKCLFYYAEKCVENRKGLQKYLKYLLTVTSLNLGTIRIHHTYIRDFLKFLEESRKNITDIEIAFIKEYFDRLAMQNIKAQSYNNKLQATDR